MKPELIFTLNVNSRHPELETDNLALVTRLLSQAVARMRIFLSSLDSFNCLTPCDRATLYRHNICTIQIMKAAISVDLARCQNDFPLPYRENLGETEAFHLITAHELYTELRGIIFDIQSSDVPGIRELPVMLLIMMVAFFKQTENLSLIAYFIQSNLGMKTHN